jgi:hypothetical protein
MVMTKSIGVNIKTAPEKAQYTAKWANIMTKWLIAREHQGGPKWRLVSFAGPSGAESRGIVDLLAIRKDHADHPAPLKKGDLFEIVLIQVKGGGAKRPSTADIERLKIVKEHYRATEIVLASWTKGKELKVEILVGDVWEDKTAAEIFGITKNKKRTK